MERRNKKLNPKIQGVDRISHLPDDVLVHVLSLLDTKDAVRTTALSREWRRRRMWVHVYNLSFDFSSACQTGSVNRTLDLHRAPKITRFSLHIQDGECEDQMLDPWLGFAVMRHVEVLNLYLPDAYHCKLPELLLPHDSLRELTTNGCDLFIFWRKVCWGLLRVLDVGDASLAGIENLLSACPSLEYLRLHNVFVYGGENIEITQKRLKKLVMQHIYCIHDNVRDPEVRVAAPRLEELEVFGCWHSITCKLVDAPSLVDVCLDFVFQTGDVDDDDDDDDGRCENAEKELREKVRQIMG